MTEKRRQLVLGYLFISPWLIGLCVFIVYPLIYNFYLGFTVYNGFVPPEWIGREPIFPWEAKVYALA